MKSNIKEPPQSDIQTESLGVFGTTNSGSPNGTEDNQDTTVIPNVIESSLLENELSWDTDHLGGDEDDSEFETCMDEARKMSVVLNDISHLISEGPDRSILLGMENPQNSPAIDSTAPFFEGHFLDLTPKTNPPKAARRRRDHVLRPSAPGDRSDIHPKHVIPEKLRSGAEGRSRHHAKIATVELELEPNSYREAISRPDSVHWLVAMQEEIDSMNKNEVWELVDRPPGNIVTNKWVFKIKKNADGTIERYKARLVARGFSQKHGVDYFDTYAPVANMTSVRLLFAYAAIEKLQMIQFDVKTAFLYGDLEETVYMEQPEGFEQGSVDKVCLLKRSLYGLKQSPRQWNKKFSDFLKEMNLMESEHDSCIFYRLEPLLIVAIYVDDGIIFTRKMDEARDIMEKMRERFEVHLVTSSTFLGFQIHRRDDGGIALHQTNYINTLLKRFNMEDCKPVDCPVTLTKPKGIQDPLEENVPYREAIGGLMYAAVTTRVDIAYAVSMASRKVENPTQDDWMAVKRILRYLKDKQGYAITYKGQPNDLVVMQTLQEIHRHLDRRQAQYLCTAEDRYSGRVKDKG